jgi:puromycin-sensitive aminopeptidase
VKDNNLCLYYFQPLIDAKEIADSSSLAKFRFQKTPIMSTYLIAFIVSEYDYVEATDKNGVLIRVYTPLGKKEQGRFALEVTIVFIKYLNLCPLYTKC